MRTVAFAGITSAIVGAVVAARESRRDRDRRAWRRRYDRHLAHRQDVPTMSRATARQLRLTATMPVTPAWRSAAAA